MQQQRVTVLTACYCYELVPGDSTYTRGLVFHNDHTAAASHCSALSFFCRHCSHFWTLPVSARKMVAPEQVLSVLLRTAAARAKAGTCVKWISRVFETCKSVNHVIRMSSRRRSNWYCCCSKMKSCHLSGVAIENWRCRLSKGWDAFTGIGIWVGLASGSSSRAHAPFMTRRYTFKSSRSINLCEATSCRNANQKMDAQGGKDIHQNKKRCFQASR